MATLLKVAPGQGTVFGLRVKAREEGKQFIDLRLSMCEVDDFKTPLASAAHEPGWVTRANSLPSIVVFDEYNRCLNDVKLIVDTLVNENKLKLGEDILDNVFNCNVEVYVVEVVL